MTLLNRLGALFAFDKHVDKAFISDFAQISLDVRLSIDFGGFPRQNLGSGSVGAL